MGYIDFSCFILNVDLNIFVLLNNLLYMLIWEYDLVTCRKGQKMALLKKKNSSLVSNNLLFLLLLDIQVTT